MTEQPGLGRPNIRPALAVKLMIGKYFAEHFSGCIESQFPAICSHVHDPIAPKQGLRSTKNVEKKLSILRLTFKLAPVLAADAA
jgi:hypothetical protein